MTEAESEDHIQAAQKAAEQRLMVAHEVMWGYEEEGGGDDDQLEERASELLGPYCGCDTCTVREVLDAAWPHIIQAIKADPSLLEDEDD